MGSSSSKENKTNHEEEDVETFLSYYLKHIKILIPIFVSIILTLNIIALFVSAHYNFTFIFLHFGILILILSILTLVIIVIERNYFWGIFYALLIGLVPLIELIIHVIKEKMDTTSLVLTIISLIFSVCFIIAPFILIENYQRLRSLFTRKQSKKMENEQ